MAKEVTTLVIEDTGIELMVAQGRHVVKWARAPLASGLVTNDNIIDRAQVVDTLKNLFLHAGISTRNVIVGLGGINALYRLIPLPVLPDSVVPEAIKREASRIIPTPLNMVYYSYQAVPSKDRGSLFFLAAYP